MGEFFNVLVNKLEDLTCSIKITQRLQSSALLLHVMKYSAILIIYICVGFSSSFQPQFSLKYYKGLLI